MYIILTSVACPWQRTEWWVSRRMYFLMNDRSDPDLANQFRGQEHVLGLFDKKNTLVAIGASGDHWNRRPSIEGASWPIA